MFTIAVGVFETSTGTFKLVTEGDLPSAVAASCAIPYIFQPVLAGVPPQLLADGGVKDRTGIRDWATWAGVDENNRRRAIVHMVGTSIKKKRCVAVWVWACVLDYEWLSE